MAANAQVVYDYTGIVTSSEVITEQGSEEPFLPVPIGTQVSGTYTLDLPKGIPGSGNWLVSGGRSLFSSTIQAGQVVYDTPATFVQSTVEGVYFNGSPPTSDGPTFAATEGWVNYGAKREGGSGFEILNPHGAWSADGLPIFAGAKSAGGTVDFSVSADAIARFSFNLTSLTRAPELDSASAAGGLTLLLTGLAMATGARRSRSADRR
jgi:hypothetical protein